MKLPTYKAALQMGKEKVEEMLVPCKVRKAKKQAELEMCKLDESIANKEVAIQKECTTESVSFEKLIKLQDELALLQRKKTQYSDIVEQMFPEGEAGNA